jgi:phosphoribosylaminoimidazolecarboxamide formyltransferase/IMP cyclohydrolase
MALNVVDKIDDPVKIQTAIVSVYDKKGLDTFIPALVRINPGIQIFSTGGTYGAIEKILVGESAHNLSRISDYTGQPEMQGGLVKTLDFKIYLGLLSETYNTAHTEDLKRTQALPIDMVVVNLYPFKEVSSEEGSSLEKSRANIDIGGPCMIRAAAKNFHRVAAVTQPADYPAILKELEVNGGALSLKTRFKLTKKAFNHTADYDTAISEYLSKRTEKEVTEEYSIRNTSF